MQNQNENEFIRSKNIIDYLENGTKYLLFFDGSCEEICNSKDFVDYSTTGSNPD